MNDIIAEVLGIPPDKAAALRMLAEKQHEIEALMSKAGDVVEVPIFDGVAGVASPGRAYWLAAFVAVQRDGGIKAQYLGRDITRMPGDWIDIPA